jgi:hypothetical protein
MNYEAVIAEKDQLIRAYVEKFTQMQQQIFDLSFQLTKLQRMVFGNKSERFIPEPYTGPNLFSELEPDAALQQAVAQVEKVYKYQPTKGKNPIIKAEPSSINCPKA